MRLLSELLVDWMQRRASQAPAVKGQSMFTTGNVADLRSGGMYLVETDRGVFWMDAVTDEPIQVGDRVWVGYSDDQPFVCGLAKATA